MDIKYIVEKFKTAKILCIGDIMLDRFVYGDVERISPEAPVPILKVYDEKKMPGGVGNVVRNIKALGGMAQIISIVGDDSYGNILQNLLKASADLTLIKSKKVPTIVKTRYIGLNQQLLRVDEEPADIISPEIKGKVLKNIEAKSSSCNLIVLSDYGKGIVEKDVVRKIMGSGIPVIVDPKKKDFSFYSGAYLITPNKKELKEASEMPVENDEQIIQACKSLILKHNIQNILATRGAEGMTLVERKNENEFEVTRLHNIAKEVYDVSGAGDTVVAVMALGLSCGQSLKDSAEIANIAGGIVVGKAGTAVVYPEEIIAQTQNKNKNTANKIVDIKALKTLIEDWKSKNLTVGFTNGCFDILHKGHIFLINQAAEYCDKLILGLNDDPSIKRLKGNARPVNEQEARAEVVAGLQNIDAVIFFSEDTPLNLIKQIMPDVLIKGADYKIENVVGAKEVIASGGKVVLADLKDGFSTTKTIAKLSY